MKNITNEVTVEFDALGENENFARILVAAFITRLNPTLEEVSDLKVAVSEAVTNAIIHGYDYEESSQMNDKDVACKVHMKLSMEGHQVTIVITDYGKGIADIAQAMEPMFTTKPQEERSGLGFAFMEAFTDEMQVVSEPGKGTKVTLVKVVGQPHGSDN